MYVSDMWMVDRIVAELDEDRLQYTVPTKATCFLPPKEAQVEDPRYSKMWGEIQELREAKGTGRWEFPLIRLGGGLFSIEQIGGEQYVVLSQRDEGAPRRPLVFCEHGGVLTSRYLHWLPMLFAESWEVIRVEIIRIADGQLLVPAFEEPFDVFNEGTWEAHELAARRTGVRFSNITPVPVRIAALANGATFQMGDWTWEGGDEAETNTRSLECVLAALYDFDAAGFSCSREDVAKHIRHIDVEGAVTAKGQFEWFRRACHLMNCQTGEDLVWRAGEVERVSTVEEEVRNLLVFRQKATRAGKLRGEDPKWTMNSKTGKAVRSMCDNRIPYPAPGLKPLAMTASG